MQANNCSYKKTYKALLIAITLYFFSTIHTEIPFTWINGLHAVAQQEHLSVVNGMIWWEQNIVENMYRYGNKDDATIQLIKELFHLQPDGVSFRQTTYNSKPAAYFMPTTIGKIIDAITKYRIAITTAQQPTKQAKLYRAEAEKTLKTALATIIKEPVIFAKTNLESNIGASVQLKKEIAKLTTENKELEEKIKVIAIKLTKKPEIVEQLTSEKNITEKQHGETKQKIEDLTIQLNEAIIKEKKLLGEESYEKINKKTQFLSSALNQGINPLVNALINSTKESMPQSTDQKYISYATEQILLALLWALSNPQQEPKHEKQDLIDYFEQIPQLTDKGALAVWINNNPYSKQDYDDFIILIKKQSEDELEQFLHKHYERAAFSVRAHKAWKQPLPPIITGAQVVYASPAQITAPFPDCVETSLRNFFNIIFYNPEKGIFDIEHFITHAHQDRGNIILDPSVPLINFYKKYTALESLRSENIYNEWTRVVENLTGIIYIKPTNNPFYEISSSVSNILNIINHLVFGNSETFYKLSRSEKLDLLCKKLSYDNCTLAWDLKGHGSKEIINTNDFFDIVFSITRNETAVDFTWSIQPGHSVIPQEAEQNPFPSIKNIITTLKTALNKDSQWSLKNYNLFDLFLNKEAITLLPKTIIDHNDFKFIVNLPECILYILSSHVLHEPTADFVRLNLSQVYNQHNKLDIIETILDSHASQFYDFIRSKLPSINDENDIASIICPILSSKEKQFYPYVSEKLPLIKTEENIAHMINDIITTTTEQFYPYVSEKLSAISSPEEISDIISAILSAQAKQFYDFVTNNFSVVDAITDQAIIASIITGILNSKSEQFYYYVSKKLSLISNSEAIIDIINAILVSNLQQFYWFIETNIFVLNSLTEQFTISTVITNILYGKNKQFYHYISEKLPLISDSDQVRFIINAIIHSEAEQFYDFITKNLSVLDAIADPINIAGIIFAIVYSKNKQFYTYVSQKIPLIRNDVRYQDIIDFIIDHHIEQLFDTVAQEAQETHNTELLQKIQTWKSTRLLHSESDATTPNQAAILRFKNDISTTIKTNLLSKELLETYHNILAKEKGNFAPEEYKKLESAISGALLQKNIQYSSKSGFTRNIE